MFEALLLTVAILFLLVKSISLYWVDSNSMDPTLPPQSWILVNRLIFLARKPRYGEVVVFGKEPVFDRIIVHRIVATEGDFVVVRGGLLCVDNRYLSLGVVAEPIPPEFKKGIFLKKGYVFQKGDNSADYYGIAKIKDIIGKALPLRLGKYEK